MNATQNLEEQISRLVRPYANFLGGASDHVRLGVIAGLAAHGEDPLSNAREALDRAILKEVEIDNEIDLTELEITVSKLAAKGLSYQEISENIGKPLKSVDNAIQRARNKVSKNPANLAEIVA